MCTYPHIGRWLRFVAEMPMLGLGSRTVHLLESASECEAHVQQMWAKARDARAPQILGLDTEWAAGPDGSPKAVLLQLCDDDCVLLLRLPQCLPSPSLTALLRDKACTVKAGVAVLKDAEMLATQHSLPVNGCVDLRLPAAVWDIHDQGKNGLQALTRAVLRCDLSKDPAIRCGNWEATPLSEQQLTYAALDAVAGMLVLRVMAEEHALDDVAGFVEPYVDVAVSRQKQPGACTHCEHRAPRETSAPTQKKGNNLYKFEGMDNRCVGCGEWDNLHRFHVVPHCFRTWLPVQYKTHNHHDILLLCNSCYKKVELKAASHREALFELEGIHPRPQRFHLPTEQRLELYNTARILLLHAGKLPVEREGSLRALLQQHLGRAPSVADIDTLATKPRVEVSGFEPPEQQFINRMLVPGSEQECEEAKYAQFIRSWREMFVQALNPEFLPSGWSIEDTSIKWSLQQNSPNSQQYCALTQAYEARFRHIH
eukprot:TRINITY_DN20699_c0_g1_i2.p1 TRINITY_DN20699_c0_g1~~TRINITY_DN20699_c0_g1_i2.p1  ORF type:complete len:483 (+),score=91.22 TRINITY_DN20699_c0_g1_i2:281-1729(+)